MTVMNVNTSVFAQTPTQTTLYSYMRKIGNGCTHAAMYSGHMTFIKHGVIRSKC